MIKEIFLKDKFFIAGGSGMVGGAIYRKLKLNGYGNPKNGGSILIPKRRELDLLNINKVEEWFKLNKPSVVIIAAAKVGGILANSTKPTEFLLENLKIQANIIETSWKYGVRRLLFLGSSCIYPKHAEQPIQEESLLSGYLEATNEWYAIAKIAGLKLCEALRKQYSFDAITLMPTNLYGPGDNYDSKNSHVMAALLKKFLQAGKTNQKFVTCWGSGSPFREFLHVDDLGDAVVFALEEWDPDESVLNTDKNDAGFINYLNVGTGKDISIFDLANKISKATNFKGKIVWDKNKPDGTPKKLLNIEKILKLGWKPKLDLDQGIKQTITNIKNSRLF